MEGSHTQHIRREEFLAAYDAYADAIFRFCLYKTSHREIALDITQQTFLKTWDYIRTGKNITNIRAFLYQVARNLITDYHRKKKEDSLDRMHDAGFDPAEERVSAEEATDTKLEMTRIMHALQQLDRSYQEVIILRFIEDESLETIATITGESKNTISVRIHRGLQKLKSIIASYETND